MSLVLLSGVIQAAAASPQAGIGVVAWSAHTVTVGWKEADGAKAYRLYRDGVLLATAAAEARRARFDVPTYRPYTFGIGAMRPSGEWLSTVTVRPRWAVDSTTEPSRPVRDVSPGQVEEAIATARTGDTLRLRPGTYPRVTIDRSLDGVTIEGGPGVRVEGFTIAGGAGGVRIQRLATTAENELETGAHDVVFDGVTATAPTGTHLGPSCWYIRGARNVTIQNSTGRGGWDVVKVYAPPPQLARDVVVRDNDLSGAYEDIVHVDGAIDMTVEHNVIHDPFESSQHNDGIQTQHSSGLRIVRNTFSWTSFDGDGGPNQAIILGNIPSFWADRKVLDTYVASNLVHHWKGGTPLILNGTERTRIVNNTFVDSGTSSANDPSLIVSHQGAAGGQNPGLEIWNNILETLYVARGSMRPVLVERNLFTVRSAGEKGQRAIVADPRFVDRSGYKLSRQSPARGAGSTRPRTPSLALDGSRRSKPPDLGAHD